LVSPSRQYGVPLNDPGINILFLGDIVGRGGRKAIHEMVPLLRRELELDFVIANGENGSGGLGLNPENALELHESGIDVLTTGNHIWKHKSIHDFLDKHSWILRPSNYPPGAPGRGAGVFQSMSGQRIHVLNLIGRTYMEQVDCPFREAEALLDGLPDQSTVIVDFHAEATSEKRAMGYFLKGKVSAVLGTHTHVQTNDAQVLGGETAYLTDAGMCGPLDSILGIEPEIIVRKFVRGLPERFHLAKGLIGLQGALMRVEAATGRALSIEPFERECANC
jgi:2',3'-cyclic-nucleotide 2'-phosphodiesterase